MSDIKYLDKTSIKDKKVIIRVDYNVPLNQNGKISDVTRIKQSLATINYLLSNNNKLILISHLGKPKGRDSTFSLKPVAQKLQELLPSYKIILVADFLTEPEIFKNQQNNQILLLENIRFYPEEKKGDLEFAKKLASLSDYFVLDGFAVAHRNDASVTGIARFIPAFGGLLLEKEVKNIFNAINNPQRPLVSIIGGAKISTKIGLIRKFMDMSDYLLVGGALANNFFKAQGLEIGTSLYEPEFVQEAKKLLNLAKINNKQLLIPSDVNTGKIKKITDVLTEDNMMDIGTETEKKWTEIISQAKTIIWNGPVGCFEDKKFALGSDSVYHSIINNRQAVSLIGGGDTLACIGNKEGLEKITHISTGGGAMLELIEKGTLPGIEALKNFTVKSS